MSSDYPLPDYELEELRVVTSREELKAIFHSLRGVLLDLVLERAAAVKELAVAVKRPPSTVAYHVGVLRDAGLLKVVRTRKIRSIDERFYGRAARILYVGEIQPEQLGTISNALVEAASESGPAHQADDLRAILRHARIPHERAAEFWKPCSTSPASSARFRAKATPPTRSLRVSTPATIPALPPATDQSTQPEST